MESDQIKSDHTGNDTRHTWGAYFYPWQCGSEARDDSLQVKRKIKIFSIGTNSCKTG
jgi:hypothetical protein